MAEKTIGCLSVLFALLCACLALYWWHSAPSGISVERRIPGMDKRDEIIARRGEQEQQVEIGANFRAFDGTASTLTGSWPCFRGSNRDNITSAGIVPNFDWLNKTPKILWTVELGEGYSGAAVHGGRVYLLDYDEKEQADALRCFSFDDGKEIWRRWYKVKVKRNHGYSRTVPAVTDKYAVTIGPMCHVMCVDVETGALLWGMDLVKGYGARVPLWYAGQCPLIDGDMAVIAVGGESLLMGVDCATGKIVFETPNPDKWAMSHSSVMPAVIHGKKMYIYCAGGGGMLGVSAEPDDLGQVLWKTAEWSVSVVVPTPVVLEDGRIFMTAGYGAGGAMFKVNRNADNFSVELLYKHSPREGLACEQHTPVYRKGMIYGVMPKDAGPLARQFLCWDPSGKIVWSSGKSVRFGIGPFMAIDDVFAVLDDDGTLIAVDISKGEYNELGRFRPLTGKDAWAPMAWANGRLLARDSTSIVCIEMEESK